jgi:hypothetical protein
LNPERSRFFRGFSRTFFSSKNCQNYCNVYSDRLLAQKEKKSFILDLSGKEIFPSEYEMLSIDIRGRKIRVKHKGRVFMLDFDGNEIRGE